VLVAKRIAAVKTARMTGTTTNGEAMCMVQGSFGAFRIAEVLSEERFQRNRWYFKR